MRWLRPGFGWVDDEMLRTMERAGYRCALGSIYPYDAHLASARFPVAYVLSNVRPGAVLVPHEGTDRGHRTVEVLRTVLPASPLATIASPRSPSSRRSAHRRRAEARSVRQTRH